jgi:uncharacterized membrane protein
MISAAASSFSALNLQALGFIAVVGLMAVVPGLAVLAYNLVKQPPPLRGLGVAFGVATSSTALLLLLLFQDEAGTPGTFIAGLSVGFCLGLLQVGVALRPGPTVADLVAEVDEASD